MRHTKSMISLSQPHDVSLKNTSCSIKWTDWPVARVPGFDVLKRSKTSGMLRATTTFLLIYSAVSSVHSVPSNERDALVEQ
jgi:hypothetical protein